MGKRIAWVEDQVHKNVAYQLAMEKERLELVVFKDYTDTKKFFDRGGVMDGAVFDVLISVGDDDSVGPTENVGLKLIEELVPKVIKPECAFVLTILQDPELLARIEEAGILESHLFPKSHDSDLFARFVRQELEKNA